MKDAVPARIVRESAVTETKARPARDSAEKRKVDPCHPLVLPPPLRAVLPGRLSTKSGSVKISSDVPVHLPNLRDCPDALLKTFLSLLGAIPPFEKNSALYLSGSRIVWILPRHPIPRQNMATYYFDCSLWTVCSEPFI